MSVILTRTLCAQFLAFYFGCLGCFLLQSQLRWSAIVSSAALGVLITFVPFSARWDRKDIEIAFATGTFVAMSEPHRLSEKKVLLASLVFAVILFILQRIDFLHYHGGMGGTLGGTAFLACIPVYYLQSAYSAWLRRS